MYRDFKTTILAGWIGTGKTHFIHKLIDEIIEDENDDSQLILIDYAKFYLYEYKDDARTVMFITGPNLEAIKSKDFTLIQDRINNLNNKIDNKDKRRLYIVIDEYFGIFYNKKDHEFIQYLFQNRKQLNIEFIIAAQWENFVVSFKKYADTYINFTTTIKGDSRNQLPLYISKYCDLRNTIIFGDETKVKQFMSNFKKDIPFGNGLFTLKGITIESVIYLEQIKVESARRLKPSYDIKNRIFAFVELEKPFNKKHTFYRNLSKIIKRSFKTQIFLIVFSKNSNTIPASFKNKIHTKIVLN